MNHPIPPAQLKLWIEEREKIQQWMETAKKRELELRGLIASAIFTKEANGYFHEGTSNVRSLVDGAVYNAHLKQPYKREIMVELMAPTLTEANLPPETVSKLIKTSYELSVKEYRALPAEKQTVVDKMIKLTAGAPQLELEHLPAAQA